MPYLTLTRKLKTDKSTISRLTFDSFACDTLEPSEVSGHLLPAGIYDCAIDYSQHIGHLVLRILGYDHDTRLVHCGNKPVDTKGCVLLGQYDPSMPDWVSSSKQIYSVFWDALLEDMKIDFIQFKLEVK
jgi:hypothetical protein